MIYTMQGKQIQEILAANIRRVRTELGYSQSELAERVDISPGYMCDIENSRKWPGADKLTALADVLKLDPYQLILPTEDSPYFDRHRTLTSFAKRLKIVISDSVDEAYEQFMQPYGPLRPDDQ